VCRLSMQVLSLFIKIKVFAYASVELVHKNKSVCMFSSSKLCLLVKFISNTSTVSFSWNRKR
jgi:hypothetical protein